MKKIFSKILCFGAIAAMLVSCTSTGGKSLETSSNSQEKRLTAIASMYPMYEFTSKIAKDKVDVINLVPSGSGAHGFELSPEDMVKIEGADLLIYNGAGMEGWIDDVKESVTNKDLTFVDTSKGVTLLENHEHEGEEAHEHEHEGEEAHEHEHEGEEAHEHEEHHHHHGKYDPHIWLGLKEAKIQLKNIKDALVEKDPQNKDFYEKNYEEYYEQLNLADKDYEEKLAPHKGKSIVVSHEAFGYMCKDYGINQLGIQDVFMDSEPDPTTMKKSVQFIKDNGITTIFKESLSSSKVVDSIAKETGIKVDMLDPIEGLTKEAEEAGEDYLSIVSKNLDNIVKSFEE